ncbi:MAG: hypothetical protein WCF19_05345 [Chlamydiales bacterium]
MSTYTDNWGTDWDTMTSDIANWQNEQADLKAAVEAYHAGMEKIDKTSDAMVAFTMLAWLMSNQGFDQLNTQSAVDGGALQIQGDLTRLNNDLEAQTNQNTTDPSQIDLVAQHSEQMYEALSDAGDPVGLQAALGTDASQALASQFQIIRQQIHDTNVAGDGPQSGWYFIAPGSDAPPGTDYITSYGQLQSDLAAKGDPQSANEAEKGKTDAFNENTSTTQSTNAASQEIISNDSNMSKAVQAFVVDMFHAIMDVISAANKATTKGS